MAANRDLELLVRLMADTKSIDSGVKSVDSKLSSFGNTIKGLGVGLGLAVGLNEVIGFLGDAAEKATSLAEAQNKADVVFGKSADTVEEWASTLNAGFRLSELQATEFIGTIGTLVKGMGLGEQATAEMSQELVQLGSDIASFNNVGIEEALDAIASGLRGESEPLSRFGIDLREAKVQADALAGGLTDLGAGQKKMASLFKQAGFLGISGDALRTMDSAVGKSEQLRVKMENLQLAIGEKVVPIMVILNDALLAVVTTLTDTMAAVDKATQREFVTDPADAQAMADALTEMDALSLDFGFTGASEMLAEVDRLVVGLGQVPFAYEDVRDQLDLLNDALAAGVFNDYIDEADRAEAVTRLLSLQMARVPDSTVSAAQGMDDVGVAVATVSKQFGQLEQELKGRKLSLGDVFQVNPELKFENLVPNMNPRKFIEQMNKELREANVTLGKFLDSPKAQASLAEGIRGIQAKTRNLMENIGKVINLDTAGGNLMAVYGASVLSNVGKAKGDVNKSFDQLGIAGKKEFLGSLAVDLTEYKSALIPDSATVNQAYVLIGIAARAGFLRGLGVAPVPGGAAAGGGGNGPGVQSFLAPGGGGTVTVNQYVSADAALVEASTISALRRFSGHNGGRLGLNRARTN